MMMDEQQMSQLYQTVEALRQEVGRLSTENQLLQQQATGTNQLAEQFKGLAEVLLAQRDKPKQVPS